MPSIHHFRLKWQSVATAYLPWETTFIWDIYGASPPSFRQQADDFLAWSQQRVSGTALTAIGKLCVKTDLFLLYRDEHPPQNPSELAKLFPSRSSILTMK